MQAILNSSDFGGNNRLLIMRKKTRMISLSALFTALTVTTIYFASIWPTGQIGLAAVASLFTAAAVIETGLFSGISVYTASSVLCLTLIPNRTVAIIYICFFGYYPVVKSLVERLKGTVLQWVIKLFVFNSALAAVWFFLRGLIFEFEGTQHSALYIFVGGSIVFLVFDYGFTKVIMLYINRVAKHTKRI